MEPSDEPSSSRDETLERVRQSLQTLAELGRYEIRDLLGEGATAIVYRGWDCKLNRPVAIKVLRDIVAFSDVARERFRREAQAAASLSHPNVVLIHDGGEAGGHLFHVMELVEGQSLAQVLADRKRPLRELLQVLEKTARGVGAAHRQSIVHRDLKPANIFVTPAGEPKVGDFGLAHLSIEEASLTRTGTPLGTPLYMSPEQVRGDVFRITARTDVYALGAILYEILAGGPPHAGDTVLDIYRRILEEDPPVSRLRDAGTPGELEAVALRALDKDPAGRYPDAEAFADDLARFLGGEPVSARPPSVGSKIRRKVRKHRVPLVALVTGLALASGAFWAWNALRPPVEAPPAPDRLPPPKPPVIGRVASSRGDVHVTSEQGRRPASPGEELVAGEGIVSSGASSGVTLRYPDGVELELAGDSELANLNVGGSGGARIATLAKGTLSAKVIEGSPPLLIATARAELHCPRGTFSATALPEGTRVEVKEGWTRVTRLKDGVTVILTEALAADVSDAGPLVGRPMAIGGSYNLLLNGSFEQDADGDGMADHWSRELGKLDRTEAHGGKVSLRLQAAEGKPTYLYQKVRLAPQTEYRLAGWLRTEGVKGFGARLRIVPLDHPGQVPRGSPYGSGSSGWKFTSVVFRTTADAREARVDIEFTASEGTVWLDEVELVPTAALPSEAKPK